MLFQDVDILQFTELSLEHIVWDASMTFAILQTYGSDPDSADDEEEFDDDYVDSLESALLMKEDSLEDLQECPYLCRGFRGGLNYL